MEDGSIYHETLSSIWTTRLFAALAGLFFGLHAWGVSAHSPEWMISVSFFLFCLFLFYTLNFRYLKIVVSKAALKLEFGLFHWTIPLERIGCIAADNPPLWFKYGGAGIHFGFVNRRYRASFNFLEHPRVAVTLNHKSGPVQEISFSTRHPDELAQVIRERINGE